MFSPSRRISVMFALLAGLLVGAGAAQGAGDQLKLRPASGLSTIPLYTSPSGPVLREVPAERLAGTFRVLQATSSGWIKIQMGGQPVWVDSYDVEEQRGSTRCIDVGLGSAPDQNRTALAPKC